MLALQRVVGQQQLAVLPVELGLDVVAAILRFQVEAEGVVRGRIRRVVDGENQFAFALRAHIMIELDARIVAGEFRALVEISQQRFGRLDELAQLLEGQLLRTDAAGLVDAGAVIIGAVDDTGRQPAP